MKSIGAKEAQMKRLLMSAALLSVALALATPAFAGHRGYYRGQRVITRHRVVVQPIRPRFSFSLGFGIPGLFYGGGYPPAPVYYRPAPIMIAPTYGPPVVWIPGHYVLEDGYRVFLEGHWTRHRHYDDDDRD